MISQGSPGEMPDAPEPRAVELGIQPVEAQFARVVRPQGLPGMHKGEIVPTEGWRNWRLLEQQCAIVLIRGEDMRHVPTCKACGRMWGSHELADGCWHGETDDSGRFHSL